MTIDWWRCPHCNVFSAPPDDAEHQTHCPACGKPLVGAAASKVAAVECEFDSRHEALSEAQVVPEPDNCVQCGCCTYNCPMGIDVRAHAWRGLPVRDSHCLTCKECVKRCPRGVLRFERIPLFTAK